MKKIKHFINSYPYKKLLLFTEVLFVIYLCISSYLIHNILLFKSIEDMLRYATIICIIILNLIFLFSNINIIIRHRKWPFFLFIFTMLMFSGVQVLGSYYLSKAYTPISHINKTYVTYSTSLVTLKSSNINQTSDLKNKKIGIINDKNNIEGYVIGNEIINSYNLDKNNTIVKYDDVSTMLNDLYDKEINAILISSNYTTMYENIEGFSNIANDTRVITSKDKKMAKKENIGSAKDLSKPFTVLVLGIDSTATNINSVTSFNGDTLILITFNPKTLNATIFSIPRDTYTPIMCFKNHIRNKITHSGWQGESCVVDTVENLTGINIDYYFKINFKGVVNLVDAVGGVYVDVPISFCEQNSNREWGKNTQYINKGYQLLNGEKALAFSRHRKTYSEQVKMGVRCKAPYNTDTTSSDFTRSQNQQTVINALVNRIKEVRNVDKLYNILNIVSNNMDTNMSTNQILSLYNIGKDVSNSGSDGDLITFEKLYLEGKAETIYDEGMRLPLWNFIYAEGSLKDDIKTMKTNLELISPTAVKNFSFSINTPYVQPTIGQGSYKTTLFPLIPNFTKYSRDWATNWGLAHNINITFTIQESDSSSYKDGQIIKQSVHADSLESMVNKNNGIILTIIKKTEPTPIVVNCNLDEDNDLCSLPNFVGKKLSDVSSWEDKIFGSFTITKTSIKTNDESLNNKIKTQSVEAGTKVIDLPHEIEIEYYKYDSSTSE